MVFPTSNGQLDKLADLTEKEALCIKDNNEEGVTSGARVNLKKLVYILSFLCVVSIFANLTSVAVLILHGQNASSNLNNGAGHDVVNFKSAQERHSGMNSVKAEKLDQESIEDIAETLNNKTINSGDPQPNVDDEYAQHRGPLNSHGGEEQTDVQCLTSEHVKELVDDKLNTFRFRVMSVISERTSKVRQAIAKNTQRNDSNSDSRPGRECALIGRSRFTPVVTPDFVNDVMGKADVRTDRRNMSIPEWHGTLFRNRQFQTNAEAPITLKFFEEMDQTDSAIERLFDLPPNSGVFRARVTGLYHIYAHIPYYNNDGGPIALKRQHDSNETTGGKVETVFGCTRSINYHHKYMKKHSVGIDYSYRICTMAGSLEVTKGDRFWLHTVHPSVTLGLSQGECYFGAFAYAL